MKSIGISMLRAAPRGTQRAAILCNGLLGAALAFGPGCGGGEHGSSQVVDQGSGPTAFFAAMAANSHAHIEGTVTQTNLVADQVGPAVSTDPHLLNAWGLAFNPKGPAWVSSAENGTSQVYDGSGKVLLEVTIPTPAGMTPPSSPTGQVFNTASATAFKGDLFIFVTEQGVVAGWQPSDDGNAVLRADNSATEANYKGVTIATTLQGKQQLYAANFHAGKVDVFDSDYMPVTTTGGFADAMIPDGYAPFNVMSVGAFVLVTYAKQDANKEDEVKGAGNGFVDVFTADGVLVQRLISRDALNAPWGLVVQRDGTTSSFDLLVGNFGDGHINVYGLDLSGTHIDVRSEGALIDDTTGAPIAIDGLWALVFGPSAGGFAGNDLFFTAGPNEQMNGLFGKLTQGTTQP